MFHICRDNERSVMKNLFDLCLRYAVFFVFSCISFVPIKAGDPRYIHLYILDIY